MKLFFRVSGRLGLLAVCTMLLGACQAEAGKPNILLIVLDDFGYNDLAINNGSDSPTPTLDEIASRGIRFTRHYAESSCTASRVALLTGMYPARVGAHPPVSGIDHEITTLPDVLGANGYVTYMIGKWHAGDSHSESRPEFQGFDHWYGFISQLYLRGPHNNGDYQRGRPTYRDPWLENERGELRRRKGHLTDIVTDRALKVMRTEQDPWFMYLSYYAPHTPVEPGAEYAAQFPDDEAGRYQALKLQLDSNIARLLQHLEETGALNNTMIVVVSDNGGTERNWPSNYPFTGTKATYTEGGVRTPLLLWWPQHWPEAEQRDQVAMITDLYPTIVSSLGLEVPSGLDGMDLFGPQQPRQLRWYSHGEFGDNYGVLSADGEWRLNVWKGVAEQLYGQADLVSDSPKNHVMQQPQVTRSLNEPMLEWIRDVTRVSHLQLSQKGDWSRYTGAAFRRTPLSGTHSMGFVFRRGRDSSGGARQQLVKQKGYIGISELNGELRLRIDGNELALSLPPDQDCFSLFVSITMSKSNMVFFNDESVSRTQVYINGEARASSVYQNHRLATASPSSPLKIYNSKAGRWYMPPSAPPYLSTRWIREPELHSGIEAELQAGCDQGAIVAGR